MDHCGEDSEVFANKERRFVLVSSDTKRKKLLKNHKDSSSNTADDLSFSPFLYSALERQLPQSVMRSSADDRTQYMTELLQKYLPNDERLRVQKHEAYKHRILSTYKPKHMELQHFHAETFFVPSFLHAFKRNTAKAFRSIMNEPFPGIYTFNMLKPSICDLFLAEVDHIERWIVDSEESILRPNTKNKYGVVLEEFGLDKMLDELLNNFIGRISQVLFPDIGISILNSHHSFIVEYGENRDIDLGMHVDDSVVTLNVCLGKQFTGGELFFRGARCDNHINTPPAEEEVFDYLHRPGIAILHQGRHRHGARATTSGRRTNLVMWCKSSTTLHLKNNLKEFSSWCAECKKEKQERQDREVAAIHMELMKRMGE